MGEEAKPEQVAPPAEEKVVEEKKEESAPPPPPPPPPEEEKPPVEKEKKAEEPPQPPPPFVLYVDLHCVGCAKKIERTIMKVRGVEGVAIDMGKNEVTIKGVVEPQAICNMIMKKIKRSAKVLSPLPANEGEPIPDVVTSQVSGLTTVELILNMHCEACAAQLKKKILKMRGVQTAETELSSGKVTVTGTMDANKLVDYVYRRTKKQAKIVPQPEPEPEPKPENPPDAPKPEEVKEPEKPVEEPKPEEKKEENNTNEPNKEGGEEKLPQEEQPPKEVLGENVQEGEIQKSGGEMMMNNNVINMEDESMKRMMYNYNYNNVPNYYNYNNNHNNYYQPHYVIERIPPPQLFSDENPNACCIS